jgi:hypothetical protein
MNMSLESREFVDWPWQDGEKYLADVRGALRVWMQEHKRELGFMGQRQLELLASECCCVSYSAVRRADG